MKYVEFVYPTVTFMFLNLVFFLFRVKNKLEVGN